MFADAHLSLLESKNRLSVILQVLPHRASMTWAEVVPKPHPELAGLYMEPRKGDWKWLTEPLGGPTEGPKPPDFPCELC